MCVSCANQNRSKGLLSWLIDVHRDYKKLFRPQLLRSSRRKSCWIHLPSPLITTRRQSMVAPLMASWASSLCWRACKHFKGYVQENSKCITTAYWWCTLLKVHQRHLQTAIVGAPWPNSVIHMIQTWVILKCRMVLFFLMGVGGGSASLLCNLY